MPTATKSRERIHFVFANPTTSEEEKKRESQLARSHTARVNREKRKPAPPPPKPSGTAPLRKLVKRTDAIYPSPPTSEASAAAWGTKSQGQASPIEKENEESVVASNGSYSSSTTSLAVEKASSAGILTPRAISPILGAQPTETFSRGTSLGETAAAAKYCLEVIWPTLLMSRAQAQQWFDIFRKEAVMFHAFQYALAVHHDLLCKRVSWTASPTNLMHKTKTLRLLRETVADLNDDNIDMAILAVLVMARNELPADRTVDYEGMPFVPHLPEANWMSVYARIGPVEEHGRAMYMLIMRRGGIENIRLPGLAGLLALLVLRKLATQLLTDSAASADVLNASSTFTKPAFRCHWREQLSDLPWSIYSPEFFMDTGRGFRDKVPFGLPDGVAEVFVSLAVTDRVLVHCRNLKLAEHELRTIVGIRNRMQYQLISLPVWDELSSADQSLHDRTSYECCRLAALLYSNSILFPIPPTNGWPLRLVGQIVALLTPRIMGEWSRSTACPFLIWVLVICGIAASGSTYKWFFEEALRRTVGGWSQPGVRMAVGEFLWSERACGRGFDELWVAVTRARVGVVEEDG